MPPHTGLLLSKAVEETSLALRQLHPCLGTNNHDLSAGNQIRRAVREKTSVDAAQKKLKVVKSTLMVVLQGLELQVSKSSHILLAEIALTQHNLERVMSKQLSTGPITN